MFYRQLQSVSVNIKTRVRSFHITTDVRPLQRMADLQQAVAAFFANPYSDLPGTVRAAYRSRAER